MWQVKIKFYELFSDFYPIYDIHFFLQRDWYERRIRKLFESKAEAQLSIETMEVDWDGQIQEVYDKYEREAKDLGVHTFGSVRLMEYKADGLNDCDTLTLMMTDSFIEFFIKYNLELQNMGVVLNQTNIYKTNYALLELGTTTHNEINDMFDLW